MNLRKVIGTMIRSAKYQICILVLKKSKQVEDCD